MNDWNYSPPVRGGLRRVHSDDSVFDAVAAELERQQHQVELIASENIVSSAVLAAQGSVLTNKYAEGYPGRRYYGGCQHVDIVEQIAIDRARQLFGCSFANVQPHSGAQANGAVLMAMLKPGDTILGMSLAAGGHLTHGASPTLSGKWFNAIGYGVRREDARIDYDEVEHLAREHAPKLVIAGGSSYPRVIDFARFRAIADAVGAHLRTVSHARALGVLLRSIVVEREPLYRQQQTAHEFAAPLFGLSANELEHLSDDRIGRALDKLFDADRAALLTQVVLAVGKQFAVRFDEMHNDSTSVSFCGHYPEAHEKQRGRRQALITYGHSKLHRPDLKQLVLILSTTEDGGVPVQFRVADGNTNDSVTHIETWNTLRQLAGRADFLYVADSKLCSFDNMDHIHRAGGRFVTVLPRTRNEDKEFRKWLQAHTPSWQLVWNRPHPRRQEGPRDRWYVYPSELPSAETWPIVWVWSTLLTQYHEENRRRRISAATHALTSLHQRLTREGARRRGVGQIDLQVRKILTKHHVRRYLKVERIESETHHFRQVRRGRPGPDTQYRKVTRRRFDIQWETDQAAIDYDHKSDGMLPLLTNDRALKPSDALKAYKGQPMIEKRFEQLKTVHAIAPVFLQNPGRIEAFFTLYFLALLLQALIERELRIAMQRAKLQHLPLYAESRRCKRPTTEQVLRLFELTSRHTLLRDDSAVQIFNPELTPLQRWVLELLNVPVIAFRI